jgi:hypothetical protein
MSMQSVSPVIIIINGLTNPCCARLGIDMELWTMIQVPIRLQSYNFFNKFEIDIIFWFLKCLYVFLTRKMKIKLILNNL